MADNLPRSVFAQQILDSSDDCIKILDLEGRILLMNRRGQALLDIQDITAFLNTSWAGFWQGADQQAATEAIAKASAGEVGTFQGYCPSFSGKPKWWDSKVSPMWGAEGQVERLLCISRDVTERVVAEAALSASEAKYRTLLSSMDEGYLLAEIIFDEHDQPIDIFYLDANPSAIAMIGQDFTGRRLSEINPNYESHWYKIFGRVARTGEGERLEQYAKPDNSWYDFYVFKVGNENGHQVAVIFRNITERKRREANAAFLIEIADEFSRLSIADEIMQVVGAKIGTYMQITSCNFIDVDESQNEELTVSYSWLKAGLPTLQGKTFHIRDYLNEEYERACRAGEIIVVQDTQTDWRTNACSYAKYEIGAFVGVPFHRNGEWQFSFSITDDQPRKWRDDEIELIQELINRIFPRLERARTEERLRQSEEQLRLLVITSSDTLYKMSADWSEMRNLDGQNFLVSTEQPNCTWLETYIPKDDQPQVLAAIEKAIRTKSPFEFEHRVTRLDGAVGWTCSRAIPLLDKHNEIVEWFGTASDVTERKQLLEREQAARENAEQANRIKDEFLAVLSHELRSPLNPILGWSRLLQIGNLNAEKTQLALKTIERNAQLQSELIEDLLNVSRILQGKLTLNVSLINLDSILRAAMETVRLAAEAKSISIKANLSPQVGLISGDSTRLQQVIWNLLSNAVKFTPSGGQINIWLEHLDSHAQIMVSDTGQGIVPGFLPYVFDYFRQSDSTTTRKFGGLGLGLAIVRHLVELHGGTVEVESPGIGGGATFTVRLPVMPIQANVDLDSPLPEPAFDLNGVQVLVVDDEPDSREFAAFVLEQAGATVLTATTADEALTLLMQAEPDVLLSDIGMPKMDGYMLIEKVRALPPERGGGIAAIALTAYAGDFNQQQALQAGFQRHVTKPIRPERLIQVVSNLILQPSGTKSQFEGDRQG